MEKDGIDLPHLHLALGAIALRRGSFETAACRFERCLALHPRHVLARLYRARLWDLQGRTDLARAELEESARDFPSLPEPSRRIRALRLREQAEFLLCGSPAEALRLLVDAQREDPEDPLVYRLMAQALESLGETERAARLAEKARALAPYLYS